MTLDLFLAGTDVSLTIALNDSAGNPLSVTSISYSVTDENALEVVAPTPLTGFVALSPSAIVAVPALVNQLTPGSTREIRNIELSCLIGGNTVLISKAYGIETKEPLIVGVNSFQTASTAEMTALDIPNLDGWAAAADGQKIAALIEARERIFRLNFSLLNSNVNFGQDQLAYVPEGAFQSQYVGNNGLFIFNGNLGLLSATQYNALPERFKKALRQAQVAEANAILGGDTTTARRNSGLISDAIGDSRQAFRPGKPLELPVCKAALGYLSYFVSFGKKIGRG